MPTLAWILAGGLAMSAIAMVGALSYVVDRARLEPLLLPMVALAAGTLLGGAFFHMAPEGSAALAPLEAGTWLVAGFTAFLAMELFLQWRQARRAEPGKPPPVTYLVLVGDATHNFLGGLGIASTFLIDPRAGAVAWLAAAAHEIPQELGDFGVLVRGGWTRRVALRWNVVSALTFPLGALVAYAASRSFDVAGLVLFGAGNFVYIAAADLVPEIKTGGIRAGAIHFGCFAAGAALMLALARLFEG